MTNAVSNTDKSTSIKLSEQVKAILQSKGFSKIFNYNDYQYFKKQVSNSFNRAQEIADLFMTYNSDVESDFAEYLF